MDAEALAWRREVAARPERVADDEDGVLGRPEGSLPPKPAPDDSPKLCAGELAQLQAPVGNAEPSRDDAAIALVAVEELHDGCRLPQRANPLVELRGVDRIEDEHPPAHLNGMRGPTEVAGLGPAEPVLELVTEVQGRYPPRKVS